MALREDFEKIGNWFFRWRSYLPLLLIFLFLVGLKTVWYSRFMDEWDRTWEFFCLFVAFLGLAIRMVVVGSAPKNTSGRNVTEQRADSINTTGLYSVVRHPLYLGNFLMWVGVSLFVRSWWLPLLVAFVFMYYYEKIMYAEEEFLRRKYGTAFENWASQTPAFFPVKPQLWKPAALKFNFKYAVSREYSGFFAAVSICALLKLLEDRIAWGWFHIDLLWLCVWLTSLGIYIALKMIKKKTHLLDVTDR